jgi:putative cell wall-binding protein
MTVLRTAAAVLAVVGAVACATPASAADVSVRRLAGADRYATAAAIAVTACQGRDVAVARGDTFADALATVNLPAAVVLSPYGGLPAASTAALRACRPTSGWVMGSGAVLGPRVGQQFDDVVVDARRIDGRDRYATAAGTYTMTYNHEAEIPRPVDGLRTAFLTSGVAFADALSAGPVAARERVPLLLTDPDVLPAATRAALLYGSEDTTRLQQVVVVGGPSAVSDRVVRQVQALGLKVLRVAGDTRQRTAVEVFRFAQREFGWDLEHVTLTRGDGFADAVAGASASGFRGAPMLLTVGPDELGTATRELLRSGAGSVRTMDVYGDETAVSGAVVQDAVRAATTR